MKTKSLFIALVAALCILSGCTKKEDSDSSLLTEFKRAESYIDQDITIVYSQIANSGYQFFDEDDETVYVKESGNDTYVYAFKTSGYGTVASVTFEYYTPHMNDYLSNSAFADFVRYIGKSYKATFNETYNFEVCYYGEEEQQIHSFEALDSALVNLVNEKEVEVTWRNTNNQKLSVDRSLSVSENYIEFEIHK